jgi:hypothetical protein
MREDMTENSEVSSRNGGMADDGVFPLDEFRLTEPVEPHP